MMLFGDNSNALNEQRVNLAPEIWLPSKALKWRNLLRSLIMLNDDIDIESWCFKEPYYQYY